MSKIIYEQLGLLPHIVTYCTAKKTIAILNYMTRTAQIDYDYTHLLEDKIPSNFKIARLKNDSN